MIIDFTITCPELLESGHRGMASVLAIVAQLPLERAIEVLGQPARYVPNMQEAAEAMFVFRGRDCPEAQNGPVR
jgi:hypothetical protein